MRKTIYLWLMIVLLLVNSTVFAEEELHYTEFNTLYNSEEAECVEAVVGTGAFAAEGAKEPYILYSVFKEQFFEMAEAPAEKLDELDNSLWLVPLKDGGNRRVRMIDGVWTSIGGRISSAKPSQEDIDMNAAFELLNGALSESNTDPKDIAVYAVEVVDYATSFLICVTPRETLAIPYSDATHLTHLENGKLYTLEGVLRTLNDDETGVSQTPSNEMTNGGTAAVSENTSQMVLYTVIGGCVVFAGIMAYCLLKKKKTS